MLCTLLYLKADYAYYKFWIFWYVNGAWLQCWEKHNRRNLLVLMSAPDKTSWCWHCGLPIADQKSKFLREKLKFLLHCRTSQPVQHRSRLSLADSENALRTRICCKPLTVYSNQIAISSCNRLEVEYIGKKLKLAVSSLTVLRFIRHKSKVQKDDSGVNWQGHLFPLGQQLLSSGYVSRDRPPQQRNSSTAHKELPPGQALSIFIGLSTIPRGRRPLTSSRCPVEAFVLGSGSIALIRVS